MAGGSKSESKQQSTSQQQSASGSAQPWANPYALTGLNEIMSVYNANKPGLAAGVTRANDFADKLGADWDTANAGSAAAGSAATGGVPYFNDVLSGKYLSGNPHLDAIIAKNRSDIGDTVNSNFSLAGRYGSGAHTDVLAGALADMENQLRFQDYTAERGYMQQAAGQKQTSLDAAAARAAQEKAAAAALAMEQQKLAAEMPYVGSKNLADMLAALFSGGSSSGSSQSTGTSSSQTKPNILGMILNAAGNAASAGAAG